MVIVDATLSSRMIQEGSNIWVNCARNDWRRCVDWAGLDRYDWQHSDRKTTGQRGWDDVLGWVYFESHSSYGTQQPRTSKSLMILVNIQSHSFPDVKSGLFQRKSFAIGFVMIPIHVSSGLRYWWGLRIQQRSFLSELWASWPQIQVLECCSRVSISQKIPTRENTRNWIYRRQGIFCTNVINGTTLF